MPSENTTPSSLLKALSTFEHKQSLRSIGSTEERHLHPSSFQKSMSMFEHRQLIGSTGSFDVPPGFRASLNIFEDGEEKNPLLPSFFRGVDDVAIAQGSDSSNDLKKEFVFSLKHTKVQEGTSLSIKQIIDFQARIRGFVERKVHKKSTKSIVHLQSIGRGFLQRRKFHTIIVAAIRCQSVVRMYSVQQEARRLYDIKNPPHIRKLRNQIAAIQLKLDAINEERERMNKERERRKAQIKKECIERFTKQERNKTLGIAQVQKSGSQLIAYFQTENNALRATMKDLAQSIAELRSENKSLESENQVVAQYTHELHTHYKKMKDRNGSLQKQADKLRNEYQPKWEDAIAEQKNHAINEARQKYVYRQGLYKIVDTVLLDQSCNSDFKDGIAGVVGRCEKEFDCEIDIDTPLELYPSPPEQQSMLSTFKLEEEKVVADSQSDAPFEFLDDADFLLPGLETHDGDDENSSSTSFSASSTTFSDSSSSTDSSDDRSLSSRDSLKSKPAERENPMDIVTYFDQNGASQISPIVKKLDNETDLTVYSTDESEYEVKSTGHDCASVLVNSEVEYDTDSGTATSRPPWETEDDTYTDPDVPSMINIPTSELEGNKQTLCDAPTLRSTASTTAIESESSSSYIDVDVESRNGSLLHPTLAVMQENKDYEEYHVGQSSIHREEPNIGVHYQSGDGRGANVNMWPHQEQAFGIPTRQDGIINISSVNEAARAKSKLKLLKVADQTQQQPRATRASVRSKSTTPVRIRQESSKSSVASSVTNSVTNPKPFHARPAPKFGEPKIPVRARNPAKLRSTFKARTASERSPLSISVRNCNQTKPCTAS